MKLIEEIVDLLSSNEPNLTTALMKTKVLLHRLGEKELLEWVDGELKGYPNVDNLPDYRILRVTVIGNSSNMAYRYTRQILPTMHLDKKIKNKLETTYLTHSIAVIEKYSRNDEDLQITIAPEYYRFLSKGLGNGYEIESAWGQHSAGAMTQILTEVQSRLLDFVLELSEKFPEELQTSEMKIRSKEVGVSDLFNNAVFGDNVTIVVGDSNKQKITNSIIKNDFESLRQTLRENGVAEDDIAGLNTAIQADEGAKELANGNFGSNVSGWIGNMVSKAASTAWDINIGVAGSLLATAISKFYGF
ncbi:hypothetical protein HRJ35_00625 [Shewanella oneidensis MR-1]|uniref:AbiTii domain-containing protein n=1 Tax=Shewanella oneidensis (strain ATCC 700550 / JCM 31522 / CIP 106686 / LMG 19005 / NCIMB 14063 / MR-1) TaxID=211586 RepID=Q8E9E3_SHEON|nr:hypothetical protein [Shewanella oneidensis]AAN57309.1 uncharacterized protein SO_4341 [Shewanella oneidensis MR-1]MDX5998382.1 hypothetical protein [Shewanella oneidensis]MEE2027160.1 hypothetical protein [Shewanella oneidensis]QKG94655.1 hypothetical protein HRJ35_00625 [Shewanella oneidensis MR-1]